MKYRLFTGLRPFMAALEAKQGSWGVFTDVVYMDLGASGSNTREFSLGQAGAPADPACVVRMVRANLTRTGEPCELRVR